MPVYRYQVSQLEEIYQLSLELAQHFPKAETVQIGIYELLLNALEHGNLAITETVKLELLRQYRWQQEVERRLHLPENCSKRVQVELVVDAAGCELTITDEGEGFDWQRYMLPGDHARGERRGLGLLMVRHAGFDAIAFNDKGNQVRCAVRK